MELGQSFIEEDKYAENQVKKRNIDDKDLIIARLLFDGGYYQRSLNILESIKTSTMMKWSARYELESDFSPSSVVVNTIRSQITNFF